MIFYEYQNKNHKINTSFNRIVVHFDIRGKLSIIRCDKYILQHFNILLRLFVISLFFCRSLMLELKRLKELQHDNITRFVGACLDPGTMFNIFSSARLDSQSFI